MAHTHGTGEQGHQHQLSFGGPPPDIPGPSFHDGLSPRARLSQRRSRRLSIVIGLNLAVVVAQLIGGLLAHSVGLLADASHNLTDVAAAGLALIAVRLSRRAPTAARSFGFHRSSVLAALANAAAILVLTVLIAVAAIDRLIHPQAVHGGIVVAVAAGAMLINGACALLLHEHGSHDMGMRSTLLHMAGDAVASLGVVIAGLVILATGGYLWLDPAVSLGIAALISFQAVRLGREVTDVLLEGTPRDIDVERVRTVIDEVPGVESGHDLHLWSLSSEIRALSAHVVLSGHPSLEEAQVVGERIKSTLSSSFDIAHATLELECEACSDGESDPCTMDGLSDARVDARTAGAAGYSGASGERS